MRERVRRIPEENLELLKRLKAQFQYRIVFVICSLIASSNKNLDSLVEACNKHRGFAFFNFVCCDHKVEDLGARGKRAAIESLAQRKAPTILIDDNHEVIEECKPEFFHGSLEAA